VDIEGAEYELFAASPDEVLCKIRYLIIEFHDSAKTPACISKFSALHFQEMTDHSGQKTGADTEVRVFRGPGA
jgi:hypothetical protein